MEGLEMVLRAPSTLLFLAGAIGLTGCSAIEPTYVGMAFGDDRKPSEIEASTPDKNVPKQDPTEPSQKDFSTRVVKIERQPQDSLKRRLANKAIAQLKKQAEEEGYLHPAASKHSNLKCTNQICNATITITFSNQTPKK